MRNVLGIDPGLRRVGYAVLQAGAGRISVACAGVIETSGELPSGARLADISSGVTELLEEYLPDSLVMERILFSRNVTSALRVAEAVGVIKLAARRFGLEAVEIGANQVKLALSGDGNAPKDQMQKIVGMLLDLPSIPKPADVADAIAIAYSFISRGWVPR